VAPFEAQAKIALTFWPDELSNGSDREHGLNQVATAYESGGAAALRALVAGTPGYQAEPC